MSPVSFWNAVAPGARVHAPLTSSETWTCPVELYSANQPTSRSPAFTAPERVVAVEVTRVAPENAAPWINVGDVLAAGVVTLSGADCGEWLPAPSNASTV